MGRRSRGRGWTVGLSLFDDEDMPLVNKTPPPVAEINAGMAAPNVSRWDKIKAGVKDAGTAAMNNLMPEQKGLEGLLSPEDYAGARKQGLLDLGLSLLGDSGYRDANDQISFGQALGRGAKSARAGYEDKLGSTLQSQQYGQAAKQQKSLLDSRAAIAKQFVAPPNETFEQAQQRLVKMFTAYSQSGDTEMMGKLSEVVKGIQAKKPEAIHYQPLGGTVGQFDASGKQIGSIPTTPSPKDPNATNAAADIQTQRSFTRENQLGDDYRGQTKQYAAVADAYGTITSQAPAARAGNAQAQIALVFAFMKSLDPSSTVRESEYATAKNAAGVPERVRNQWNKLKDGSFLTAGQVDGMVNQSTAQARTWQKRLQPIREQYKKRAERWKVDPSNFVYDYFADLVPAESKTSTGNPLLGR